MKNLSIMLTDAMYKKVIDHKLDSSVPVQIVESIRHGKEIRWIPVSERLPEEYGNYLTTVESSDGTATIAYQCVDHYGPGWLHEDKMKKVIAWQPLPKPYSEVSE